ncbi:MAG: quinone-dependent dihydroorotate dehydrogenase, partial [Pseudomonadota bacterium]
GLRGAPLLARAIEILGELRAPLDYTIDLMGVGGITRGDDAAAKVRLGARAVQIYSGLIYRGPELLGEAGRAAADHLQR